MTFVSELAPAAVWRHFDRILRIPRGSKQEEAIRDYVLEVARAQGLEHRVDAAGNVVVYKPAAGGAGGGPTVLQSHLDMVNEKNADVEHDFGRDPILPVRDGDYLTAQGTTLGSDNGIGVAAMLALIEATDVAHGPLELLFTVDEESGLTGASNLAADLLDGRQLLNLDSEEEGALYVGCAGGAESHVDLPLESAPTGEDDVALAVAVRGFRGGHSGVDIHLQRGNAIRLLARTLHAASPGIAFRLATLRGGTAHNAIPREAFAEVLVSGDRSDALAGALRSEFAGIRAELDGVDPDATLDISPMERPAAAWQAATTTQVLRLLTALPHGVLAMSHDLPDLVETSTNLATVRSEEEVLAVLLSSRSSVESALTATCRRIRAVGELAGAHVEESGRYPGWRPNMSSPLLAVVKAVYRQEFGDEPEVKAIHAGLETGIIGEKYPGMDMISFGPRIEFPHSPGERVHIPSVERFWRLLTATLERLGEAT